MALLPAVSWPWVPAWGSLEPPRRDGENAQKTGKNGRYGLKRVEEEGRGGITWISLVAPVPLGPHARGCWHTEEKTDPYAGMTKNQKKRAKQKARDRAKKLAALSGQPLPAPAPQPGTSPPSPSACAVSGPPRLPAASCFTSVFCVFHACLHFSACSSRRKIAPISRNHSSLWHVHSCGDRQEEEKEEGCCCRGWRGGCGVSTATPALACRLSGGAA